MRPQITNPVCECGNNPQALYSDPLVISTSSLIDSFGSFIEAIKTSLNDYQGKCLKDNKQTKIVKNSSQISNIFLSFNVKAKESLITIKPLRREIKHMNKYILTFIALFFYLS